MTYGNTETATTLPGLRPRRSVLFVPGSNARAVEKARTSEADCIILDLEDMVGPDEKDAARVLVADLLAAPNFGARELVVRVNGLDTPWGADDLAALAGAAIDALLLPKIDNADILAVTIGLIDGHGGAQTPIWLLAETPRAIQEIDLILASSGRVKAIVMGTEDLAKSIGLERDAARSGLLYALSRCVYAARAAGISVIDGVSVAVKDEQGFADACRQGRLLGFDGKAVIHPAQIAVANLAFDRAPRG